jgi:transposase
MSKRKLPEVSEKESPSRRRYTEEFKAEAVQMLLDGHTAASVCERLGLSGVNLLYLWKRKLLRQGGPAAVGLEARVRQLEGELRRVERERDILKKALSIFGRDG